MGRDSVVRGTIMTIANAVASLPRTGFPGDRCWLRFAPRLGLAALLFAGPLIPRAGADANELATPQGLAIRSWGTDAGLPQNTVNVILQTREGYLWLGTQNGLARFDGVQFTPFGLGEGLRSVQVKCLIQDRQDALWIGTLGGGLSRLAGGRIRTFSREDGLNSDNITALATDREGNVWIGTRTGLYRWKEGRFTAVGMAEGLPEKSVRTLYTDRRGRLWVVLSADGIFELRNGRFTEVPVPFPGADRTAYCLLEDTAGRIWASEGNGIVLCRKQGVWSRYAMTHGLPYSYVTCLAEDADGTVWAGSLDEGLYYFKDGHFTAIRRADGLSDDAVRSVLPDREGNLWVGTRAGGLDRLTRKSLTVFGAAAGLTHEYVRSVAETSDGQLWVATTGGGLYRGVDGRFSAFTAGDPRVATYAFIETVLVTRDDRVWWAGSGVLASADKSGKIDLFTQEQWPWLKDETILALGESRGGGLWLGTLKSGLKLLRHGAITSYTSGFEGESLSSVVEAPDGSVWVGTIGRGLRRRRGEAVATYDTRNGLRSDVIRALHLDAAGDLWIGTVGGGLSRWHEGRLETFTTQAGLPENTVSQILEDDRGNLWLGGNRGIVRVSKLELEDLAAGRITSLRPLVLGKAEGMWTEECSSGAQPSGLRTRAGLLCFPTVAGLVVVDPARLVINTRPPTVVVEGVVIDGRRAELSPGSPASAPGRSGMDAMAADGTEPQPLLTVPPGKAQLEFQYTALSYTAPEAVRFRYRLEGLERDWVDAGRRRAANYSHLPPGDYTFHVLACNNNGVWNEVGASQPLRIRPHFWQTWWFLVVAVGLIGGTLGGTARLVVRRRLARATRRLEHLRATEQERARIAQDLHDDLGSGLTEVVLLGELARQANASSAELKDRIADITAKARQLVAAMDEIVWTVNPRKDSLPNLAGYVAEYAQRFLAPTPVRCRVDLPDNLPNLPLSAPVRHNLFLAAKEALNNVARHSGASEAWLRVRLEPGRLRLVIEDNGRGFDPAAAPPGRNGLRNLRQRLESLGGEAVVETQPGRGTRIEFILPLPATP